jgi:hypothetical protein
VSKGDGQGHHLGGLVGSITEPREGQLSTCPSSVLLT